MSDELLAKVSVLRDFLLFREKPDLCSHLFDTYMHTHNYNLLMPHL